ncbi:MAG: hypothetical protein RMM53_06610 [Bacteroidia bacterium]|nr:hypothetical protein [Bacteroidia bacterium]MDW8333869.1 hypothetical protein [Bacteroidia bacterium]
MKLCVSLLVAGSAARGQTPQEEAFLQMVRDQNGAIVFSNPDLAAKYAERHADLVHRQSSDFDVYWSENSPLFVEADLDSDGKNELLAFFEVRTRPGICKAVAAFRGSSARWSARDVLADPGVDYEYVSHDPQGVLCKEKARSGGFDFEVVERLRRLRMYDDYLAVSPP